MIDLTILASLLLFIIIGMPIFLALALVSLMFMIYSDISLMVIPQVMSGTFRNFVLLAIPLFMLAGRLMNSGGVTERLFDLANGIVGHITGGLAQVNVLLSIIFAGMSGSALADTAGLGEVEIKTMIEKGFDRDFAAAVTAASGSIGPIIPPSIIMIIYGSMAGVSIGGLFLGGIIPGLIMGLGMMIINYFICKKRNYPTNEKAPSFKELLMLFYRGIPPLLTPLIILGGIIFGIFTPTEAALVASLYAFVLGFFVYKELTVSIIINDLIEVIKTTSSIMIIIAFASIFARVITQQGIPQQIASFLTSITTNHILLLLIINIFLLLLGCFMDVIAALIATIPILLPIVDTLPITRLHFGVVMILNLTIALITPPMGASLFVVTKIAKSNLEDTFIALLPFIAVLISVLLLITFVPPLVTFLPNLLM